MESWRKVLQVKSKTEKRLTDKDAKREQRQSQKVEIKCEAVWLVFPIMLY